jgi:polysaccharide biosynthesis protein PslH
MARVLALVSFSIFPTLMGGQKGVACFYEQLKNTDDILLAVSTDNGQPSFKDVQVFRSLFPNRKMPLNLFRIRRLRQLIQTQGIECIITEHSYTAWIGWLLRKRTGVPFIIHSHNLESERFRQMGRPWWRLYRRYEAFMHRAANHNFFIREEDLRAAVEQYHVPVENCSVVTYGVEPAGVLPDAQERVRKEYQIEGGHLFYFNGTMDYLPNTRALEQIMDQVIPRLRKTGQHFTILVSGNRLKEPLRDRMNQYPEVRFLGFVNDVNLLYQASDVFLNAVTNNTGVKTKAVEALMNGCPVVSMRSGALGLPMDRCGAMVTLVADNDWGQFTSAIEQAIRRPRPKTPSAFLDYFNGRNIAAKASAAIHKTVFP